MNETPTVSGPNDAVGVAWLLPVADAVQRAVRHAPHANTPAE